MKVSAKKFLLLAPAALAAGTVAVCLPGAAASSPSTGPAGRADQTKLDPILPRGRYCGKIKARGRRLSVRLARTGGADGRVTCRRGRDILRRFTRSGVKPRSWSCNYRPRGDRRYPYVSCVFGNRSGWYLYAN